MKKLKITVNGTAYDVTVEDLGGSMPITSAAPVAPVAPAPAPVAVPVAAPAPVISGGAGNVPSPLAGRVISIDCKVGANVAAGETVITLEAMKMNTFISAPASGVVKEILVKEGDAVEEGQTLVVIG